MFDGKKDCLYVSDSVFKTLFSTIFMPFINDMEMMLIGVLPAIVIRSYSMFMMCTLLTIHTKRLQSFKCANLIVLSAVIR